jgi:periplasmic glucans biosynthesis protein
MIRKALLLGTGEMSVFGDHSSTRKRCRRAAFATKIRKDLVSFNATQVFSGYQDLEAHYESRPSAWIEPKGMWGAGCAELLELPTQAEYFDNIVVFWRPDEMLVGGQSYNFDYRIAWCDDAPPWDGYRAGKTRVGQGSKAGTIRFVIDFLGPRAATRLASAATADNSLELVPIVSASAGVIEKPLIERNYYAAGIRVSFDFDPQNRPESDLRLALFDGTKGVSEVWIFRWRR